MRRYTRSIVVAAALAFDAGHSAPGSEQAHPAGFAERIQPILDANCVACHQTGSAQQGLVLETGLAYRNLVSQKSRESNLELVRPGVPESSYLVHKLRGSHLTVHGSGAQMPLGSSLEANDLQAIVEWIRLGANND